MSDVRTAPKKIPIRTPTQLALRRFRKSKLAMAGLAVLAVLYLAMLLHGFIAPYGYNHPNRSYSLAVPAITRLRFKRPDGAFRLRPWFVPGIMKRDAKSGENVENRCGPDGRDTLGRECTYNPQELVFFARPEAQEDAYDLLWLIPSKTHLFGTRPMFEGGTVEPIYLFGADQLGRDIFSRLMYGSAISLTIGLVGILISFTLGILIGGMSGYYGGWIDDAIQRVGEVFMSVPSLYLILAIQAVVIQSLQNNIGKVLQDADYASRHAVFAWFVHKLHLSEQLSPQFIYTLIIVILAFVNWAAMARVVRGMVLALRELDYVTAARAMGARDLTVIVRHLLPNTFTFLIIQATLSIPYYILSEVVLSFLGVGIKEPAASWGTMLTGARQTSVLLQAPWLLLPGAAIFVTVMAYNLLGDGLRDALDPKQKIK